MRGGASMEINGVPDVPVDVRTELESYEWERPRWLDEKLIACSPFRQDSTPSFYVWLRDVPEFNARAGYWGDSGGVEYQRGNFVTLLAYLRGETEDETARYLLDKRSEEHTSELQSRENLVCRLL